MCVNERNQVEQFPLERDRNCDLERPRVTTVCNVRCSFRCEARVCVSAALSSSTFVLNSFRIYLHWESERGEWVLLVLSFKRF